MHHKLIVFGIVLVAAVAFGFLFWSDLQTNQQEIANTPVETPETSVNQNKMGDNGEVNNSENYDSMDEELNEIDLNIDSNSAELESEASGL